MSDKAKPMNMNSPLIQQSAERQGMTVPEFVEFSVLFMMEVMLLQPGQVEAIGKPLEKLEALRTTMELVELIQKMPREERLKYLADTDLEVLKGLINTEE